MTPSSAPIDPADGGDDDHLEDRSDDHLDDRGAAAPSHRVAGGGPPTGAQAAAIAAALAELRRVDAAAATAAAELAPASQVPAWTRAGLAEGTGRVSITRPQELPRVGPL